MGRVGNKATVVTRWDVRACAPGNAEMGGR